MSNPDPRHDPENTRIDDHHRSPRSRSGALSVKAFGSEHNPKALKRLLKKSKAYRLKHF